jgi:flagellar basal body rod protein FlgG
MIDGLAIAAQTMSDDMTRMSVISQNLANVSTIAYRKQLAVNRPFVDYLALPLAGGTGALPVTLPLSQVVMTQGPGTQRRTANPLDFSIEGDGFFELRGAQGPVYTRRGDFRMDERSRLTSASGLPVMGVSGEIQLASNAVRVDSDGKIYDRDAQVGQLRIVRFADPAALEYVGEGLYVARTGAAGEPLAAGQRVRQGYLENANVTSAAEMVRLIETLRHFEANQKVIQGYDQMLERAIRALGEF